MAAETPTNVISFQVDGRRYDIDLFDIDGIEWRDAKHAAGARSQVALIDEALRDRDFEATAALLWIWRRRDEPGLAYEAVLSGLSFGAFAKGREDETSTNGKEPDASPPG